MLLHYVLLAVVFVSVCASDCAASPGAADGASVRVSLMTLSGAAVGGALSLVTCAADSCTATPLIIVDAVAVGGAAGGAATLLGGRRTRSSLFLRGAAGT